MLRTMNRLAFALVAALGAAAVAPEPARAASAVLTAYDVLARPGDPVTLRFKVERDDWLGIRRDLRGVRVEVLIWDAAARRWNPLGDARSGDDGYADLAATAPAAAGDHWVAARAAPRQRYASGWRLLWLGVRPPSERIVVTDIDWTIAAVNWHEFMVRSNARTEPVRGALQGLRDIADDATVVYLTARDDYFANKTRAWLAHWAFPRGPAIFSDGTTMMRDPTDYKTAAIAAIKARFPDTVAGFGNKPTDHRAYAANGLRSYQWTTETRDFPQGALVYRDWEDLRAAVRRGERPELGWATLFR